MFYQHLKVGRDHQQNIFPSRQRQIQVAITCCFVWFLALMVLTLMTADLKCKVWRSLQDIRPVHLKESIAVVQKDSIPVVAETDIKKLLKYQRRRWSEHKRAQREEKNEVKKRKRQQSKEKQMNRLQKLREYEASKRRRAKEVCKRLQHVLVPTNIPDKHGFDATVLKVCINAHDTCVCVIFAYNIYITLCFCSTGKRGCVGSLRETRVCQDDVYARRPQTVRNQGGLHRCQTRRATCICKTSCKVRFCDCLNSCIR